MVSTQRAHLPARSFSVGGAVGAGVEKSRTFGPQPDPAVTSLVHVGRGPTITPPYSYSSLRPRRWPISWSATYPSHGSGSLGKACSRAEKTACEPPVPPVGLSFTRTTTASGPSPLMMALTFAVTRRSSAVSERCSLPPLQYVEAKIVE